MLLVLAVLAGRGAGAPAWNLLQGTYTDALTNASGLSLIQAVTINPGGGISIAPSWIWAMPNNGPAPVNPPVSTDMAFSTANSATQFADVFPPALCGTCFEDVHLMQTFFSAYQDMVWKNDCWNLKADAPASITDPECLIYPVSNSLERTLGAHTDTVLLVPDVSKYNLCQTNKTCLGSGDYKLVELHLRADVYANVLMPGQNYNATWWVRSPGEYPAPPTGSPAPYNNRLCRFVQTFSYSVSGAWQSDYDSLGGASNGCNPGFGSGCLDRKLGCGVRLLDSGLEPGSGTLYLNDPADPNHGPYTPYSFSFTPGALNGMPDPWHAWDCTAVSMQHQGENDALCRPTPTGIWNFMLETAGNGNVPDTGAGSSVCHNAFGGPWPGCENDRAAASLYIDGMTLTAGTGRYMSPPFNSLSPNTVWTSISWDLDLSLTTVGGLPRTPVELDVRQGATTAGAVFAFNNPVYPTVLTPVVQTGTAPLTGMSQYIQFQTQLASWDNNPAFPPPPSGPTVATCSPPFCYPPYCLRYDMMYNGTLSPHVKRVSIAYTPDAGRIISTPITPSRLKRWSTLTYDALDNQGLVVADVLNTAGAVLLHDVKSGDSLVSLDPGQYPSLEIQFTLTKGGNPAADPRVLSFKVTYVPMDQCLSLNHNTIRLSRGEPVAIRFCSAKDGTVDVKIHDAAGQLVKKVFHGDLPAGTICQKIWNGTSDLGDAPQTCSQGDNNPQGTPVAPGVYFVTVISPGGRETARLAVSR